MQAPGAARQLFLDVLSVPDFAEQLVTADALRHVVLVARDVANLAISLGVPAASMAPIWEACAAASCGAGASVTALKAAAAAHPSRDVKIPLTQAKLDYRLTDGEVKALPLLETRRNPHYASAAPMRLYSQLAAQALAHRKYGSAAAMEEAKRKGKAVAAQRKRSHQDNVQARRDEVAALLVGAGLSQHQYNSRLSAYVERGADRAAAVEAVEALAAAAAARRAQAARAAEVAARLAQEGLPAGDRPHAVFQPYVQSAKGDLGALVAQLRAAKAKDAQREEQRQAAAEAAAAIASIQPGPCAHVGCTNTHPKGCPSGMCGTHKAYCANEHCCRHR